MVLQDHDPSFPLETREWRGACRLVSKDQYGRRIIEKGSVGDIICNTLWKPSTREQAAWAAVWPSVCLGTTGDEGIGPSGADGDPNVGAEGGKGAGGAGGVAGAAGGAASQIAYDNRGTSNQKFKADTSVGLGGGTVSRGVLGSKTVTQIDVGASIFTGGRLVWRGAGKPAKKKAAGDVKAWWGNGAGGAAGDAGIGGVGGPSGGGPQITPGPGGGGGPRSIGFLPLLDEGHATDHRFKASGALLVDYWPSFPEGVIGLRLGGTDETSQQEIWVPTDPRLFAPNFGAKGSMGSLVYDLDDGKIAIGRGLPGVAGRGARLQTMMIVQRFPDAPAMLGLPSKPCGNVLAWQGRITGQEGWPGLGAYASVAGTDRKTKTTGGAQPQTTVSMRVGGGGSAVVLGSRGAPAPTVTETTTTPGGAPVCCLTDHTAHGPFHGGFGAGDKHKIDATLDGETILPTHIGTGSYFAKDSDRDAPLHFEDTPYRANRYPLPAYTHLVYDARLTHDFFGRRVPGMWRWWTEVPYMSSPPTSVPVDPTPPSDPPTPPSDPPITPREPGEPQVPQPPSGAPTTTVQPRPGQQGGGPGSADGPGDDWSLIHRRRPITPQPRATAGVNRTISALDAWSFPVVLARPQRTGRDAQDFRGGSYSHEAALAENATRPVVARLEAFGYERGTTWEYSNRPGTSRYEGGDAAGGWALMAPQVDMMDQGDSFAPAGVTRSTTYLAMTPGTHVAFGTPRSTLGDLADGGYRAGLSGTSLIFQTKIAGTWTDALGVGATGQTTFYGSAVARVAMYLLEQGSAPATAASTPAIYAEAGSRLRVKWPGGGTSTLAQESPVEDFTSDDTLTAAESGKTVTNTGASGTVTLTLPAAASGLAFTAIVGAAFDFVIKAAGADTIQVNATSSAGGGTATAAAVGRALSLVAVGTVWYAIGQVGAWVVV